MLKLKKNTGFFLNIILKINKCRNKLGMTITRKTCLNRQWKNIGLAIVLLSAFIFVTSPAYSSETSQPDISGYQQAAEFKFPVEIAGFVRKGKTRTYTDYNIYLFLHREADMYMTYNYRSLLIQKYQNGDRSEIEVQLYKFGSVEDAFGIFSQYTNSSGHFINVGSEGFRDQYLLYFYKGEYFVRAIISKKYNDAGEATIFENLVSDDFAGVLSDFIPSNPTKPEALSYFPEENLVKHTLRYNKNNFLGLDFLPGGYEAYYEKDGQEFRAFVTLAVSGEEAERLVQKITEVDEIGNAYEIPEASVIASQGSFVVGVIGFSNPDYSRKLLTEIIENINKT